MDVFFGLYEVKAVIDTSLFWFFLINSPETHLYKYNITYFYFQQGWKKPHNLIWWSFYATRALWNGFDNRQGYINNSIPIKSKRIISSTFEWNNEFMLKDEKYGFFCKFLFFMYPKQEHGTFPFCWLCRPFFQLLQQEKIY